MFLIVKASHPGKRESSSLAFCYLKMHFWWLVSIQHRNSKLRVIIFLIELVFNSQKNAGETVIVTRLQEKKNEKLMRYLGIKMQKSHLCSSPYDPAYLGTFCLRRFLWATVFKSHRWIFQVLFFWIIFSIWLPWHPLDSVFRAVWPMSPTSVWSCSSAHVFSLTSSFPLVVVFSSSNRTLLFTIFTSKSTV